MATPVIDIYRDLIQPLGEGMRNDERFREIKNIIYDADEVDFSEGPAIHFFVDGTLRDHARGSGSASLQTRWLIVDVTFEVYAYARIRHELDEALFYIGGLLIDWLRENTDFNSVQGVGLGRAPITWNVERNNVDGGGYMGIHRIIAEFDVYSGVGK